MGNRGKGMERWWAEVLEVTKVQFINLLKENDIPYFNYSEDEWQEELNTINKLLPGIK
mgnify:CR=1 FL=1